MSEMSVDVGLNIDANQYLQTMGQAVAVTKQYVNVAGGLNGAVASANKGFVGLTNRLTGFNKVSTVAVETAAAYQKQMSGIESKAAITGKSFAALEKTTKSMARSFPIGMGQAVDVVDSLMKAGVKSERQIASLGTSFVKLGAATGVSAAVIGTEMLQLSKTMGNGASQFDALSDSVVGATAKLGGSVPSVIAFSKALAPVASTVGISQTAVMGLSTAMSSLGEDGYRAANTFNKVLLDMNRSIRDGGPELKSYADLMGTTSDRLAGLFKTNPTEVLNQFAEAVAKQGPNISRQMEAIGFDSVRDTRSLTALARAGGSRNAINEAVSSYGSGKTAEAAGVTMGGVIDQADMLKESMSQVVANVGKPMLGIAKTQLQIAGDVSNAMASITESAPGQAVLGGTGVAGAVGGAASQMMLVGGALAMGKMMFGQSSAFGAGRAFAAAGETLPRGTGPMSQAGYAAGSVARALRPGGGVPGAPGAAGALAQRSANFAASGLAKLNNIANVNYIGQQAGMSPVGQTVAGQAALANIQKGITDGAQAAATGNVQGVRDAGAAMKAARADLRTMGQQMGATPLRASAGELVKGTGTALAGSARLIGSAGLSAASSVASGASALGLSGPMLGIIAAAGAGYTGYKMYKGQEENLAKVRSSSGDIYSPYNSFAESVGKAGKGLLAFSAQVDTNTNILSDQNTTMEEALKLSNAEITQAGQAGYESRFKLQGNDMSVEGIAAQVQSVLGPSATPDLVARAMSDISNQAGAATAGKVGKSLEGFFGPRSQGGGAIDYEALLQTVGNNKGIVATLGGGGGGNVVSNTLDPFSALVSKLMAGQSNDVQANLGVQMSTAAMQKAAEVGSVYGGTEKINGREISASDATVLGEAQKIYEAALGKGVVEQKTAAEAIRSLTGMSEKQALDFGLGTGIMGPSALQQGVSFGSVMEQAAGYTGEGGALAAGMNYQALAGSGYDFKKGDLSMFGSTAPDSERESRTVAAKFDTLTGASSKLTEAMYGAEKAARDYHTTVADLSDTQRSGLSAGSRAQRDYDLTGADDKRLAAGQEYSRIASTSKGPNGAPITGSMALFSLQLAASGAGNDTNKQRALTTAAELKQRDNSLQYAGKPQALQILEGMQVGRAAQQMPPSSNSQRNEVIQSGISIGMQAEGAARDIVASLNKAAGAMKAQERSIGRQTGLQIGAIRRDSALSLEYAQEDYTRQRQYGKQDFGTTVGRAKRDYGTSVYRAEEDFARSSNNSQEDYYRARSDAEKDYNRQTTRAQADFDKQRTHATEDYETNRVRATRDYNLQVSRAGRDFHLGEGRALEDFNKSQTRATVDYNRGRARMVEDFNKQITRMVEDSAKSMYDPYKRIAAQMVMDAGQLVTNLKDQAKALTAQTSNLAEARSMGLKDETIKALGLADATNGQQLSRLLEDMRGNKDYAQSLNDSVSTKAAAATALATDAGSTVYARSLEDFNTALSRSDEDFAVSMGRAADDFATQTARGAADFATSMADSKTDFTTAMTDASLDFNKQMTRNEEAFLKEMSRGLEEYTIGMERMARENDISRGRAQRQHDIDMQRMAADFAKTISDMWADYQKNLLRSEEIYLMSIERMKVKTENAISDISAQMAAQITSMHEAYVQMFQQSPDDPVEAAKAAKAMLKSLGIDQEYWGDEIKAALALMDLIIAGHPPVSVKERERGTGGIPITTPENSSPNAHQAYKPLPPPKRVYSWKDFFIEDWGKAETWTGIGGQLMAGISKGIADYGFNIPGLFAGLVTGVKSFFGIESPSTVFAEIGKNIVEGLRNGISDTIGGVWEQITGPIKDLDIGGKVETAFNTSKTWLGTVGTKIKGWVKDGWDSLWKGLEDFDLGTKVSGAFTAAGTFLGTIGTLVKDWIDTGWDSLWNTLPTAEIMGTKLSEIFTTGKGSFLSWIQGLPTWITTNMPTVADFTGSFSNVIDGMKGLFSNIIEMWNELDISPKFHIATIEGLGKFSFPGFEVAGKQILPPFVFGGVSIPGWDMSFPDLVPNMPNPFSVKKGDPKALGGIVTSPEYSLLAEAGYPEAVIPLNERGAEVLASTMGRYLDNNVARGSQSMANSTRVVNNYSSSYDYRTEYSGAITVQAQDPEELAMRLAARKKVQRLAQPIGGAR